MSFASLIFLYFFLPAVLALNVGVVLFLVVLTLLFGRIYCSVICPLGVLQDLVSWFSGRRRRHRNRFVYRPARTWLRWTVLVLFIGVMAAGLGSIGALIAPYSAYGRMVQSLVAPFYGWGNNLLAWAAERLDSYAFYSVDVWLKSLPTLLVAGVTFVVIFVLAWRGGRTWCNTVCPVGTVLGELSRFSLFKPRFDVSKCNGCKFCARNCKASCIDPAAHTIDYSRCVACMDCLEHCRQGAISYTWRHSAPKPAAGTDAKGLDRKKSLSRSTAASVQIVSPAAVTTDSPVSATVVSPAVSAASAASVNAPASPASESSAGGEGFAPRIPRCGGTAGGFGHSGPGEEGRRRTGLYREETRPGAVDAARAARSPEPAGFPRPLHGLPALCDGLPESGAATVGRSDAADEARDVVRTRLLPSRVHEVRGGLPDGCHPPDGSGREVLDPDRPLGVDSRKLRGADRRRLVRQLCPPLPGRGDPHGAERSE